MATPTHRILIVDDEEDSRTVIRQVLSTRFEVVEASDGLDALQKLPYVQPDLVVLDVMMPLMDGFQTCLAIRRSPEYSEMPVMFLSALTGRDELKKGYESGANLYLTKPFDPMRLLRNVEVHFQTTQTPIRDKKYTMSRVEEIIASGGAAESQRPAMAPPPRRRMDMPPVAPEPSPGFQEEETESLRSSAARQEGGLRARLLIVDDDEDLRAILMEAFADDFEVVDAADGIEAVERIVTLEPDLVLIDALMPRMSGYQLCQSLRRNRRYAQTPIVFISAKASPKDIQYAQRLGANDFIPKPFELEELRSRLMKLTTAPGFRLQPKTRSIADIDQDRQRVARERSEREKLRQLQLEKLRGSATGSSNDLERFIRDHEG